MWRRFTLDDIRVIGHYLGMLVLLFSAAMAIPFITAIVCGEWDAAQRYLKGIGVALVAGSLLRMMRIEPAKLDRQQAIAVTGMAWIALAFVATVPLYASGHYVTYLDALFDCVSGLTTTGASILLDLDHLSNADNMFRFVMHFLGGLGLIVVAMSLGLFGKGGSANLYSSEARSEHVLPSIAKTTRFISVVTVVIVLIATILLTLICLAEGMAPARAFLHSLWLSISGFVTGGFTPMSQSVMYYHSGIIEMVLMVLMVLGSINFILYSEIRSGRARAFVEDIEFRTMLLWLAVMTFIIAVSLSVSPTFSDLPALLRRGLFMIVSTFSTTGFQNITTYQLTTVLSSGAFFALAIVMSVGGGAGSTSGGIKINRMGIIYKSLVATVKEALAPDSARVAVAYNHVGRRVLSPETVREAMTVFIMFVITYVIGTLVGIAHGYEAAQALFESVAMTSNGGLITGLVAADMPVTLEVFYIFQMWAGRLEFVTLFALLAEVVATCVPSLRSAKGAIVSQIEHRVGEQ